jgi:hypothetical protein
VPIEGLLSRISYFTVGGGKTQKLPPHNPCSFKPQVGPELSMPFKKPRNKKIIFGGKAILKLII